MAIMSASSDRPDLPSEREWLEGLRPEDQPEDWRALAVELAEAIKSHFGREHVAECEACSPLVTRALEGR